MFLNSQEFQAACGTVEALRILMKSKEPFGVLNSVELLRSLRTPWELCTPWNSWEVLATKTKGILVSLKVQGICKISTWVFSIFPYAPLPSWGYFGATLAYLGSVLASSWPISGPFWGHLGAVLGAIVAPLRAVLGYLGAVLADLATMLKPSWKTTNTMSNNPVWHTVFWTEFKIVWAILEPKPTSVMTLLPAVSILGVCWTI